MSEPMTPEKARATRYGRTGAITYDPGKCVARVASDSRFPTYYQCERRNGLGPHGLYCATHDPAAAERRRAKSQAKWEADREAERRYRIAAGLSDASLDELRAEIARREGKS